MPTWRRASLADQALRLDQRRHHPALGPAICRDQRDIFHVLVDAGVADGAGFLQRVGTSATPLNVLLCLRRRRSVAGGGRPLTIGRTPQFIVRHRALIFLADDLANHPRGAAGAGLVAASRCSRAAQNHRGPQRTVTGPGAKSSRHWSGSASNRLVAPIGRRNIVYCHSVHRLASVINIWFCVHGLT